MPTHRIAVLQTRPVFGERERNLEAVERLLEGVWADLVVLPELFAVGYSFADRGEARELAEPFPEGPTVRRLARWSARTRGVFVGGYVERAGSATYNAAAVVAGGRPALSYRKIHLFGFEPEVFDPGRAELRVIEHRGLRVGAMICFDWIFPEAARALALRGADVIAHPSNLVLPWCQRAMPIRALENGVYVATANRVGAEDRPPRAPLAFTGHSLVAAPRGEVLAEAGPEDEACLEVPIDVGLARDKRLPSGDDLLRGRRPERYQILRERPLPRP